MKLRKVLVIQGHPDSSRPHLLHSLSEAYAEAATSAGHEVRRIQVSSLDFPVLRSQEDWEHGTLPASLSQAQDDVRWCDHLVLFFPLWLGDMPALLKAFLEQLLRPGFAFRYGKDKSSFAQKGLKGRSARVVVTMGMPALLYRWYFRAHTVRSLERNILGMVGVAPVHETLIGMVGTMNRDVAEEWQRKLARLGERGE